MSFFNYLSTGLLINRIFRLIYLWMSLDRKYYLLANEDVARAVKARRTTAVKHYIRHGRAEGRRVRLRLRDRLLGRVGRKTAIVAPKENYLSGFTIYADAAKIDTSLNIKIYKKKKLGSDLIYARVLESREYFSTNSGIIMFNSLPESANQIYIVELAYYSRSMFLHFLRVYIEASDLIYSNPEPALAEQSGPSSVVLSPVTQCNLNCTHCISRQTRKSANSLSDSAWTQIRHHIDTHNLKHMAADYSGDIFYQASRGNHWFDKMVDANIDLEFDTHANNLDDEVIDKIMGSKTSIINFSLDSFDPATYKKIRKGSRPLEEVLERVSKFMAARNSRRSDIKVCISFVLMRSNLSSLTDAILFAKKHNVSWVQGSYIAVFTEDMIEESPLLDMQTYSDVYHSALDLGRMHGVEIALPPPVPKTALPTKGHFPCIVPWHGALVLGTGDVMACCMPGTKLGNLEENSLTEIWVSDTARRFRSAVNTDQPPEACRLCAFARLPNNFESYVPGLAPQARSQFVTRVMSQKWFNQTPVAQH